MITNVSLTTIYCLDQTAARDFYVDKLGFEPRTDAEMWPGARWVTVGHPDHPELEITLMVPGPPLSDEAAAFVRDQLGKGAMGGLGLQVDDCRATYEELIGQGRRVPPGAGRPALRGGGDHPRQLGQLARPRREADGLTDSPVCVGPAGFVEIGDGVLLARYPQWDVSVGLVVGSERALVVDTRGSEVQGREVVDDLARLALPVPVTVVVNTHVHYDHTFGNRAFGEATIHAHERVGETFDADAERLKARFRADPEPGPDASYTAQDVRDLLATVPRGPDVTFATSASVDARRPGGASCPRRARAYRRRHPDLGP